MDIPYILFVEDFPRTEEDSDASMKAYMLKHRSELEAWTKDRRAPTLQKYSKAVLQYFDENQEKYEKVVPKEFKYSDAFQKAIKTDDFSEWHDLLVEGGIELEKSVKESDEENPEWKDRTRKDLIEMEWEMKFVSKIENGSLPPLTNEPEEDPDTTQ